ncbi:hypothetical protein V1517DRAFT_320205 [Lipomyces orientalis]|uniref:Uncharacterized protein n=1 Tax=Lipomyces orientalis TaxID=1233043 RepID=A0ACC3TS90_9ASCO
MADRRIQTESNRSSADSAEQLQAPPNDFGDIFSDLELLSDHPLPILTSINSNAASSSTSNTMHRGSSASASPVASAFAAPVMQAMTTASGTAVPPATTGNTATFNGPMLNMNIPRILPHEKVFSIQVGDTLFRLSGASLSSDAPSYFTQFFTKSDRHGNSTEYPVLYIDRSPEVFRDIVRHLQGYYVVPRDVYHSVYLYADAHYYQLPKLAKLLFNSEIFVRIGGCQFTIPRELLTKPGDSPNFFTLGFSSFFSSPQEVFPGTRGLIRPPAVSPPSVPAHSNEMFAQLLQALKGAPIKFESPEHRDALLRECRYYHFRGLEQRLIPFDISKNLFTGREEISIRLKDLKPQGVGIEMSSAERRRLEYSRPFVDDQARELVIQVEKDEFILRAYDFVAGDGAIKSKCRWSAEIIKGSIAAEKLRTLIKRLPEVVDETDVNGPVRLRVDFRDGVVIVNGADLDIQESDEGFFEVFADEDYSQKRRRVDRGDAVQVLPETAFPWNLCVQNGQFKIYVERERLVLHVVCLDAISTAKAANRRRAYLV